MVLKQYMHAAERRNCMLFFFGYIVSLIAMITASIWLSQWTDEYWGEVADAQSNLLKRQAVYGVLVMLQCAGLFFVMVSVALGSIAAGTKIHQLMISTIMRAPMSFYDTTPLGRITNRFTKDLDHMDNEIKMFATLMLTQSLPIIGSILITTYITPYVSVVYIPLVVMFVAIMRFATMTTRQLLRMESECKTYVFSNFSEALDGLTSIRATKSEDVYSHLNQEYNDENFRMYYAFLCCSRFSYILVSMIGQFVLLVAGIFAVYERDKLTPSDIGLSISFTLTIGSQLSIVTKTASELESFIVAVERIFAYTDIEQEAALTYEDRKPPPEWPEHGEVQFCNYSSRYREGLKLVLNDISCRIAPREKVGVVGRTGSGKSTLTLSLFRIIEPVEGTVLIDGQDIKQIGLFDLRSKLTIIPQDPVMFSGSLRFNIDPAGQFSDSDVWMALDRAHLRNVVSQMSNQLGFEVAEDGSNISLGQRQLLCLARALLRRSQILILDEATAAIDHNTDELIQHTIRDSFSQSTVITIAHRLHTIMDYDKIMVLDQGRIVEFDLPMNLLSNQSTLFFSMAKDAGLV